MTDTKRLCIYKKFLACLLEKVKIMGMSVRVHKDFVTATKVTTTDYSYNEWGEWDGGFVNTTEIVYSAPIKEGTPYQVYPINKNWYGTSVHYGSVVLPHVKIMD